MNHRRSSSASISDNLEQLWWNLKKTRKNPKNAPFVGPIGHFENLAHPQFPIQRISRTKKAVSNLLFFEHTISRRDTPCLQVRPNQRLHLPPDTLCPGQGHSRGPISQSQIPSMASAARQLPTHQCRGLVWKLEALGCVLDRHGSTTKKAVHPYFYMGVLSWRPQNGIRTAKGHRFGAWPTATWSRDEYGWVIINAKKNHLAHIWWVHGRLAKQRHPNQAVNTIHIPGVFRCIEMHAFIGRASSKFVWRNALQAETRDMFNSAHMSLLYSFEISEVSELFWPTRT